MSLRQALACSNRSTFETSSCAVSACSISHVIVLNPQVHCPRRIQFNELQSTSNFGVWTPCLGNSRLAVHY